MASADHVGGDVLLGVLRLAGAACNNGHADLEERAGTAAALAGSAPASNGNSGSSSGVAARGGEISVGNVATGGDGGSQLPDGNVEVMVFVVVDVVGVDVDGRDGGGGAARGVILEGGLMSYSIFSSVCFAFCMCHGIN